MKHFRSDPEGTRREARKCVARVLGQIEKRMCPLLRVGDEIQFEDEGSGVITLVAADRVYIEGAFFTGWMLKAEILEAWGIPD